jgi:hypothetical protein
VATGGGAPVDVALRSIVRIALSAGQTTRTFQVDPSQFATAVPSIVINF